MGENAEKPVDKKDVDRSKRAITRATIKRDCTVAKIRSVHELAQRVKDDATVADEFIVAAGNIDTLGAHFEAEDNEVLDNLVQNNCEDQYSASLPVEVLSMINGVRAIANRVQISDHGSEGKRDVSEDGSVNRSQPSNLSSRLPEIPLPSFKGNFHYWPTFHDRFTALVHSREDLSLINKMHYLIGCLHGPAADAIRSIPVSADNYQLAWATLSTRFNRPRLVATSLINKLLNASVSSQETLPDLNTFIATFGENIALLNALAIPDLGSFITFSLASRCLPPSTRKLFESNNTSDFPTVNELLTFVQARVAILEVANDTRKNASIPKPIQNGITFNKGKFSKPPQTSLVISKQTNTKPTVCSCCQGEHIITSCRKFEALSVDDRNRCARELGLCYVCLSSNHWANKCRSKTRCGTCQRKHHVLLHGYTHHRRSDDNIQDGEASLCTSAVPTRTDNSSSIILGTALVHIRDRTGVWQTARALVDSASQVSAITQSCSERLGLRPKKWTAPISGLSGTPVVEVRGQVECAIQPRFADNPRLRVTAWVLPSITSNMPRETLPQRIKDEYSNLALADPTFHVKSSVDLLLSADMFSTILDGRKIVVNENLPTAFSSIFGWILIGPVLQHDEDDSVPALVSLTVSLENLVENFWRVEEPDLPPAAFTDDGRCEELYMSECCRMTSGRFNVPLPTRSPMSDMNFPGSREHAIKRFESLERKLSSDAKLKALYSDFMSEYMALGHMSVAETTGKYYIPHHAIYRPADGDNKIRVVFDASAKSSQGISLNDRLFQGPKLQQDIVDVLTRFRIPKFAFTADICKMYRQILVLPEYRTLQHIFWRDSIHEKLVEYELNTVTYGLNCAPFLTLRVLRSIASDDCVDAEAVRDALNNQTYVDDICSGADSVGEILQLQADLTTILGRAGLELKKWSSNTTAVLDAVPSDHRVPNPAPFDTEDTKGTKVLGLRWHPSEDYFCGALNITVSVTPTKRGMLSLLARFFDPLGLFAPVTFKGKCIMQRTWAVKVAWDSPLPEDIFRDWTAYVDELPRLEDIKIPRHIGSRRGSPCLLLGFCDASQLGYAAVIYIRMLNSEKAENSTFLIGSKTKLAPIKPLTIPRLELNAALLLARWLHRIKSILNHHLTVVDTYAWTDSTIVLSWLTSPHNAFKIYVTNRAHQIATLVPDCKWLHVRSEINSADAASRGVMPSELPDLSLYWDGPNFIRRDPITWTDAIGPPIPLCDLPETRPTSLIISSDHETEWFRSFSSFDRLSRIVARIFRFIIRCRNKRSMALVGPLQREEIDASVRSLVITSQHYHLTPLIHELTNGQRVSSKSLARLCPFMDRSGIVRVGGRLRHSNLDYDSKHPMLLAKGSHLALLICRRWHKLSCHAGARVVTA